MKFFTDAGIPTGEAANHAVTFVQHRISQDMLLDLTKEYLNDMGITMMGDVIAILKHAKALVSQVSSDVYTLQIRNTCFVLFIELLRYYSDNKSIIGKF